VIQEAHNKKHGIVPKTIKKRIVDSLATMLGSDSDSDEPQHLPREDEIDARIEELEKQMLQAASSLDFEQAIQMRDEVRRLEAARLEFGS
jgi:excinuclease ABC subunit B